MADGARCSIGTQQQVVVNSLLQRFGSHVHDHVTGAAAPVDPLLVEPLWWQAGAQTDPRKAVALYQAAVDKQPKNAQTWLAAGLYAADLPCPRLAYHYLERYTELDPKARASEGADAYRKALAQVNTGKPKC